MVSRRHPSYRHDPREVVVFPSFLLYDTIEAATPPCSTHLLLASQRILRVLADGATLSESKDWLKFANADTQYSVTLTSPADPDPSRAMASAGTRPLLGHPPSYNLISAWLANCTAHHSAKCSLPNGSVVPRLKFIDCQTRRIVNTSPNAQYKYVALSYVWGQDPLEPYTYPQLPATLPPVIEDAITFVLGLGLNYRWVDRYCIWQEDQIHKMSQVSKMDEIYGGAYFTIIASPSKDPRHGLPGVSANRRGGFQL